MARTCFGIAGYMGAGKSTVARLLTIRLPDALVIDADREAKKIMAADTTIMNRLAQTFGPMIVDHETINFSALGWIVFASSSKLLELNAIVHPPLVERLIGILRKAADQTVILDAALLPLWNMGERFDACLWIEAQPATRLARLIKTRGDLDENTLRGRMRLQEEVLRPPPCPPWRLIENNRDTGALEAALDAAV